MAGQLKEVRNRIKSVISIQQITKAMKMVSAAKFKKAQDAIVQMRPYALKLSDLLQNISANSDSEVTAQYTAERPVKNVLIVLITSDKGLCGAFNSTMIKMARQRMAHFSSSAKVSIICVGKKGFDAYRRQMEVNNDFVTIGSKPKFDQAASAAEFIMQGYAKKEYDRVEVIYSRFKNAASQVFTLDQYLPVAKPEKKETKGDKKGIVNDFVFEPDKDSLIAELVPKILKTQFFRYLLESNASEHGARMTAMDKASDNANEILKDLRIAYNRARQAAITTELTEIVSGAAALQEA